MPANRAFFSDSYRRSIGSLYTDFYAEKELLFLEDELYQIYSSEQLNAVSFFFREPSRDDPLLRINIRYMVIILESMPFFTMLLNKYLVQNGIEITRSLHFHPDDSRELIYLEIDSQLDDRTKIQEELSNIYFLIRKSKTDFHVLMDDRNAPWFTVWQEPYNALVFWLLRRAYLLEGACFIDNRYDFEKKFGNVDTAGEGYLWFQEKVRAPAENGTALYAIESRQQSFLGDGDYFYLAFISANEKLFLSGSLNEFARSSGMLDIPVIGERFEDFLKQEKIQTRSGLARITRTMFNYLPVEIMFLLPESSYGQLHRSIIEYTFKNKIHSFGIIIDKDLSLIVVLIPEENWSEEKWLQAGNLVSESVPGCKIKDYQVFKGRVIEGFILVRGGNVSDPDLFELTSRIEAVFRSWQEIFRSKWLERNHAGFDKEFEFSSDYTATHSPEAAVADMESIIRLSESRLNVGIKADGFTSTVIHSVTRKEEFTLSRWVAAIVSTGLSPISQKVFKVFYDGEEYTKSEFHFHYFEDSHFLYKRLNEIIYYSMEGSLPVDLLSSLVLQIEIDADGLYFLKALRDYCLQTNPAFHSGEFNQILIDYSIFSFHIWQYFVNKFRKGDSPDPAVLNEQAEKARSLSEDRVLKAVSSAVMAIVRTDFFGTTASSEHGVKRGDIAFKIDSSVPVSLPEPRPWREIFVYSSGFQGIHLRGGPVARGGIRYSDRLADFRTEILALMKTQMVKNVLIVPVGSKGGFVIMPHSQLSLKDAYIRYITALLSLTDNMVSGKILPFSGKNGPYTWDENDPYLVVAADKGTAQLSDTANSVSLRMKFWLGDAFASGGSEGYSHKEFGITAKGALITADRRFRSKGRDFRSEPVTVVGIGDMGGDVFGNGLVESRFFRLVAAFNHKYIFIDPDPDIDAAFAERQRLFTSDKPDWDSYNRQFVSAGGGVYSRTDKSIQLSDAACRVLGTDKKNLSGVELVRVLLKAPVDMLYNGGIGTYVKSSLEENAQAGDIANNEVRVNGNELRAAVVCEGGNLGFTQEGRIEYSLGGGDIFTDAVDNSAGVDLSDHEVNLKIFFSYLDDTGKKSGTGRNSFLKEIAPDVVRSVLLNNQLQSLAVNTDEYESAAGWDMFIDTADYLESKKVLDPVSEHIPPGREEWQVWKEQAKRIPKPVLCVLFGYAKMDLYREVMASGIIQPGEFGDLYLSYFPARLVEKFRSELGLHPLHREILVTLAVNFYINFTGISGLLLFRDGEPAERMELFKKIFTDLYQNNMVSVLNELALVRSSTEEQNLYKIHSDMRNILRNRWRQGISGQILKNNPVSGLVTSHAREYLMRFAGNG